MKSAIKYLLVGGASFFVGAAVDHIVFKKSFEKKYKEETDLALNEAFELYKEETDKLKIEMEEMASRGVKLSEEIKNKIDLYEPADENEEEKYVQYNTMFETEDDDEEEEMTPEEMANEEHERNKHRKPKIISSEDIPFLSPHIEERELHFYRLSEDLIDPGSDEPLSDEEIEQLIGDSLTKYGFIDSNESDIYVMNYAMDVCFHVLAIAQIWDPILLGEGSDI